MERSEQRINEIFEDIRTNMNNKEENSEVLKLLARREVYQLGFVRYTCLVMNTAVTQPLPSRNA